MKSTILQLEYHVNTLVINPGKQLGLVGLLGMLQDIAWVHATQLGYGFESMTKNQLFWVLTRQKVVMNQWPVWGDVVKIRTWPRPITDVYAIRDFEIMVEDKKVGECSTSWLMLDLLSRRPVRNSFIEEMQFRTDHALSIEAEKISLRELLTQLNRIEVRNSDLDVNDHVNNTRYAQWILDSMSPHIFHFYQITNYDVNFLAETHVGDTVVLNTSETNKSLLVSSQTGDFPQKLDVQFQGLRENAAKPVFLAQITAIPVKS